MRKIIVSEFVALDSVMEAPGGGDPSFPLGGWAFRFQHGAEGNKIKLDETLSAGALLLGRLTYEGFAKAWPSMPRDEAGFADKMNNMPKYVVSTTLSAPTWNNTTVVRLSDVPRLKEASGGDLLVAGSGMLVRALTEQGLVDELRLMVYPTALGTGKSLFAGLSKPYDWRLSDVKRLGSDGVVLLTYLKRD
jgi:dihydrofolate reductase